MDWQNLLTAALTVAVPAMVGWISKARAKDEARAEAIELAFTNFRIEVATNYVRHTHLDEIKDTLRRIEGLLHTKADKVRQ